GVTTWSPDKIGNESNQNGISGDRTYFIVFSRKLRLAKQLPCHSDQMSGKGPDTNDPCGPDNRSQQARRAKAARAHAQAVRNSENIESLLRPQGPLYARLACEFPECHLLQYFDEELEIPRVEN